MNLEAILDESFGTPTPKQELFYSANTRYVGYGGARGGGKSHAIRAKATGLALTYTGIKILIIRRTFSDLTRLYVRPLQSVYAQFPEECKPNYSSKENAFTFPNNSMIEMGFCASDADADNYRGLEWDVVFIDEATDHTEYAYGILNSCVRGVNKYPKRTYVTCNPGGIGHNNIKRLFITKEYRRGEKARKYTFIQAHVWDNTPLLMSDEGFQDELKRRKIKKPTDEEIRECMYFSDYVQTLDNLPKDVREAHLNGDWNVFSGQYFPEWDERVHLCEPIEIPAHWRKTAAFDYGLDRFAVLWFAADEQGKVYCYRNFEESNLDITSAANVFKELSRDEKIEVVVAPFDTWNRRQDSGKSMAEIFAGYGIPLVEAGRERIAGWANVKEYLRYEKDEGRITTPPKMVFFNTLKWIIKFIPSLQFDIHKPNDVMKEPHDQTHSPDALRYWCSIWQLGTEIKPREPVFNFSTEKPKDEGFGEVTEEYLTY